MTFEQRVQDALRVADDYEPSPDLFDKVWRSIEEDAAHRVRVRRTVLWLGAAVAVIVLVLWPFVDFSDGRPAMDFAVLEWLVTAVMAAVVLVMGPAIRRFGELFEQQVFAASPDTGVRFLRLLDIAYYLIFSAYIFLTLQFEPTAAWGPVDSLGAWTRGQLERLGGLLLTMGALHALLLLALPVVGLVVSANERRWRRARLGAAAPPPDPVAQRIDMVITVSAWVLAALVALQLAFIVINMVLLGLGGA